MAYDGLITSFLGQSVAASRPAAPNISPAAISLHFATDTGALSVYGNSTWNSFTSASPFAVTFNNGGAGAASGTTYNGSAAKTISYNSIGAAASGAVTGSGLTMATARVLGRTTASSGAIEEISIGSGLTLSAGTLSSSVTGTVTTTGSPASGNLAKFSGATSIVNGDLSGDVTTSGTLAATIPNNTVTYAKMQDVSATSRILGRKTAAAGDAEECTLSEILDFIGSAAQGDVLYRGASSWARLAAGTSGQFLKTLGAGANPAWGSAASVPYDYSPPLAADFTLFTGDATAATKADDADLGVKVTTGSAASTSIVRGAYKALPAGDFTLIARVVVEADNLATQGGGIIMYESATNKSYQLINFGDPASNYQLRKQSIAAGGASTISFSSYHLRNNSIWLKFVRSGSTLTTSWSYTGKNWFTILSESQTTYFTTAPDRIGPGVWLGHASAIPIIYVPYWSQTW